MIRYRLTVWVAIAAILALPPAACQQGLGNFDPEEIDCADGVDNDGDGFTDCFDVDCAAAPNCGQFESCSNGADDDGDGLVDCDDPDCVNNPACQTGAEICDNGFDDDGDGFFDCADSDCATHPSCIGGLEDCTNVVDDDGDGLVDCDDPDCGQDPACQSAGDCCTPHANPGCDDATIEACVCAVFPDCCTQEWDVSCVAGYRGRLRNLPGRRGGELSKRHRR